MTHHEQIAKLPQGICECGEPIYLSIVEEKPQWIHKFSGSAYCNYRGEGKIAKFKALSADTLDNKS